MQQRPGWANARDAKRLFSDMRRSRDVRISKLTELPVVTAKRTITVDDARVVSFGPVGQWALSGRGLLIPV